MKTELLVGNTRMGPPWRPQTRKMRFGGSAGTAGRCDIYGESTLRIGNRLVLPVWSFHTHGTHPVALWVALNTRMGPPWRPQTRKLRFGGSAGSRPVTYMVWASGCRRREAGGAPPGAGREASGAPPVAGREAREKKATYGLS